jgi:carboxylate-amine ligase
MYRRNTAWRTYARSLIEENKWRAIRYSTDAKLIDFGLSQERPFIELADELVDFCAESTALLGTEKYLQTIKKIAREGTSAHRQAEVFEKTQDLKKVVDWVIAETMSGI